MILKGRSGWRWIERGKWRKPFTSKKRIQTLQSKVVKFGRPRPTLTWVFRNEASIVGPKWSRTQLHIKCVMDDSFIYLFFQNTKHSLCLAIIFVVSQIFKLKTKMLSVICDFHHIIEPQSWLILSHRPFQICYYLAPRCIRYELALTTAPPPHLPIWVHLESHQGDLMVSSSWPQSSERTLWKLQLTQSCVFSSTPHKTCVFSKFLSSAPHQHSPPNETRIKLKAWTTGVLTWF